MLEIEELTLRFGGVTALDGVGFSVGRDSICGLIGPNGAGKTSLFNCVTRVYRPSSGSISFETVDLLAERKHRVVRRGIARTFQNLALFPTLSVLENVVVGAHSRQTPWLVPTLLAWPTSYRAKRKLEAEAFDLLRRLDLTDVAFRPARGLPFGTLKRVELARALMSHPRLLLLDEPAGGLTHSEVHDLGDLIVRLRSDFGFSALLVEHHMGLVMGISDHVVAMDFGRKIAEGTPKEVAQAPQVIAAYLGQAAGPASGRVGPA